MWGENAYVAVCITYVGTNIAQPLADTRCRRRLSCGHPYSAFLRGRIRNGFHSATWCPRCRLERELLGFSTRPSAGLGSRANEDRSSLSLYQRMSKWPLYCTSQSQHPASDCGYEGSDPETLGRKAHAGDE